jgi:dihydroorotase
MGLLLKGGEVLDPGAGLAGALDVRLRDGRVAEVGPALAADGDRVEDVTGRLVVPGLIDLHAHCFIGAADFGPRTDEVMARTGVTTMVDGGSAGAALIEGMRRWVIEHARVRILAFLHISALGLAWMRIGEVHHLPYADVEAAVGAARDHADLVVGIKVRMEAPVVGEAGLEPLRRARRAADALGSRVMVHVTTPPVPLADILALLRPGDIVTHFLHGRGDGILDDRGQVKLEVWRAREQGIVLDVGHGRRHVNFDIARAAFRQGLRPDTISSDLNTPAAAGVARDLPHTMS